MKKILLSLILILSIFLVSCSNETTTVSTEYLDPDIIVEFSFDMIEENANDYDPIMSTYYIDDVYMITEVKVLVSEYQITPYEWEYYNSVNKLADSFRSIFNDIRTDEVYENLWSYQEPTHPGLAWIYLTSTQDEDKVIEMQLYINNNKDTSLIKMLFYDNSTLYFYYEFDQFTDEIITVLDILYLDVELDY